MAQTNKMIIAMMQDELAKQGILKYTGRVFEAVLPDGQKTQLKEVQPIHTFAGWKALGYKVKKGEHAIAQFAIWKMGKGRTVKDEKTGEETEKPGRMFLKNSHWFSDEQVEKIEK
jgi:hypothetical protein